MENDWKLDFYKFFCICFFIIFIGCLFIIIGFSLGASFYYVCYEGCVRKDCSSSGQNYDCTCEDFCEPLSNEGGVNTGGALIIIGSIIGGLGSVPAIIAIINIIIKNIVFILHWCIKPKNDKEVRLLDGV
jgi:hypothetical protein